MEIKILWFDIETAPECLSEEERIKYNKRSCWENKIEKSDWKIDWTFKSYFKWAWLYPEFSRVVCFSYRFKWKTETIIEQDEKVLLQKIWDVLVSSDWLLWWYNIYNFDIPFLWKRFIINWLIPPQSLCIGDVKPRELKDRIVDVMQLRKQTSFTCSLDLLSQTLLWESPKSDWSGEYVASAWKSWNLGWIQSYCNGDVEFAERCYLAILYPTNTRYTEKPIVDTKILDDVVENTEITNREKVMLSPKEIAENKMAESLPWDWDDLPF